MSTTQYTPGPWHQMPKSNGEGGLVILGPDEIGVGAAWSDGRPECEANARLMSVAPELFEALEGIVSIGKRDLSNSKYDSYFESARWAIRKVKEK